MATEEETVETNQTTFNQLAEIFQQIDDSQAQNLIESITYNVESQTIIIQMKNLVKEYADEFRASHTQDRALQRSPAAEKIRHLSTSFAHKFPDLLRHFGAWITPRKELIKEAEDCANKLDRNSLVASVLRILTSTADLVATWMRSQGNVNSLVHFSLENAFTASICFIFIQMTLSKRMHYKIKILIETDIDKFQPIKQWFQQTKELDDAVRNFFPYGISEDLVLSINKSAATSDEYTKIFMSVIASNAQKDIKLFKDMEFLDNACKFSESDAGVAWYRKVLLENNPVYIEFFKHDVEKDIKTMMAQIEDNSKKEKPDDLSNVVFLLMSRTQTKHLLNGILITSSALNVWDGGKSEESRILRKLGEKTKKEFKAMEEIIYLLKPAGINIDAYFE